jgi:hypothetical protein
MYVWYIVQRCSWVPRTSFASVHLRGFILQSRAKAKDLQSIGSIGSRRQTGTWIAVSIPSENTVGWVADASPIGNDLVTEGRVVC